MKVCKDCRNKVWGDGVTDFPQVCIDCKYVEVNGEKEPSNWKPRPMSNADRIRAMSDEQLAKIMVQLVDLDVRIPYCQELPECGALLETDDGIPAEKCEQCMLAWLRKPAEVDDGKKD